MKNWQKWLFTLLFGAGLGAGVVPQIVQPTPENPTGVQLPAPVAQNTTGQILGALAGMGAMAAALQASLGKK